MHVQEKAFLSLRASSPKIAFITIFHWSLSVAQQALFRCAWRDYYDSRRTEAVISAIMKSLG